MHERKHVASKALTTDDFATLTFDVRGIFLDMAPIVSGLAWCNVLLFLEMLIDELPWIVIGVFAVRAAYAALHRSGERAGKPGGWLVQPAPLFSAIVAWVMGGVAAAIVHSLQASGVGGVGLQLLVALMVVLVAAAWVVTVLLPILIVVRSWTSTWLTAIMVLPAPVALASASAAIIVVDGISGSRALSGAVLHWFRSPPGTVALAAGAALTLLGFVRIAKATSRQPRSTQAVQVPPAQDDGIHSPQPVRRGLNVRSIVSMDALTCDLIEVVDGDARRRYHVECVRAPGGAWLGCGGNIVLEVLLGMAAIELGLSALRGGMTRWEGLALGVVIVLMLLPIATFVVLPQRERWRLRPSGPGAPVALDVSLSRGSTGRVRVRFTAHAGKARGWVRMDHRQADVLCLALPDEPHLEAELSQCDDEACTWEFREAGVTLARATMLMGRRRGGVRIDILASDVSAAREPAILAASFVVLQHWRWPPVRTATRA